MFQTWKENFFDYVLDEPHFYMQCSVCEEDFDDHYHSAMCERCYYEDVGYCALDTTVDNMDDYYGMSALEEGIVGLNPHFIRDFIGKFMEVHDERYDRIPVPTFAFAGKVRDNYDLCIRPGERERWKIPLALGIMYYAFFKPRGIAFSSYVELWLSLLPPAMIYHTDGFIASVKTAAEVPFAIAASRFNIEYLIALIHSVIYTEDIAACLVPDVSKTVGLIAAVSVVDSNMELHSEVNELNETGLIIADRGRATADPIFWEPLLAAVVAGVIDETYGFVLDVVIPSDWDDIGMWKANVIAPSGEYQIYVRRECCNVSAAFGPESLSMHVLCSGSCGSYTPWERGYNQDVSDSVMARYWRHVTASLVYAGGGRPVDTHRTWGEISVMQTPDDEWVLSLHKDGVFTGCSGTYVFPYARWVDTHDYETCASAHCMHLVCRASLGITFSKRSYAYIEGDTDDDGLYFLSKKELEKIANRKHRGLLIPWQVSNVDEAHYDVSSSREDSCDLSDDVGLYTYVGAHDGVAIRGTIRGGYRFSQIRDEG